MGVKVDVRGTVAMFGWASGGYAAAAGRYHNSLEASVAAHFSETNAVLNSMCCDIESLYNLQNSAIARVGEDYYPTIRASHTAHVAAAAFTSLHVGPLAFTDWDMMQSLHDWEGVAELHAAARAVSGGLVYVSDRPGEHDFALLRRLVLPDGSTLRARFHGRPTRDCLFTDVFRDRKTVLKIWNMNAVTGIVGAFNVQGAAWDVKRRSYFAHDSNPPALRVAVCPEDVPGLVSPTGAFVMYSDAERQMRVVSSAGDVWEKELRGGGGHDVFVISPVFELQDGARAAPIGLVGMLNAGGAVLRAAVVAGGASLALDVRGCGEFLVYASRRPEKVVVGGAAVEFSYDEGQGAVVFTVPPPVQEGAGEVLIKF